MTQPYLKIMPYGYGGGGKTTFSVSSMWDFEKNDFIRKGYWITFGSERNPSIKMPQITLDQAVKGEYGHIVLTSPLLDTDKFIKNFAQFCRFIYKTNYGKPVIESVVVDGLSELDLLFETTYAGDMGNKYAKWNDLLAEFFAAQQVLNPDEINAHVFMTARVMRERKGTMDRATHEIVGDDPDFIPGEYRPSIRGKFGQYGPHYFDIVTYMDVEEQLAEINGRRQMVPIHQAHMVTKKDYLIKNVWLREWLKAGSPAVLKQPTFDMLLNIVKEF